MEERYLMLLERCEVAFYKWVEDKTEDSLEAYKIALSLYQDFCMDVLERLMDENPEILRNMD